MGTASQAGAACVIVMAVACPKPCPEGIPYLLRRLQPERVNPGDRNHRIPDIVKVTAGSTPATAGFVDHLYSEIITAGTHKTSSIRVAEAAKVIENTQVIDIVRELETYNVNVDVHDPPGSIPTRRPANTASSSPPNPHPAPTTPP